MRIVLPELLLGGERSGRWCSRPTAHLLPSQREEQRRRQRDLRLEAVAPASLPAREKVVELIGAPELDVGLHATESYACISG